MHNQHNKLYEREKDTYKTQKNKFRITKDCFHIRNKNNIRKSIELSLKREVPKC